MNDFFDPEAGQTPLDPDELQDLIPSHIRLKSELNEFEAANIERAVKKHLYSPRRHHLDDTEMLKRIHKDMFHLTWKWAGTYRQSNKNLGKDWWTIPEEMAKACDDLRYWVEKQIFRPPEIAVRFHHRLVSIHPFPNGNGRHARLVADVFLKEAGERLLTWGAGDLYRKNPLREAYIKALQEADRGDFSSLLRFARS